MRCWSCEACWPWTKRQTKRGHVPGERPTWARSHPLQSSPVYLELPNPATCRVPEEEGTQVWRAEKGFRAHVADAVALQVQLLQGLG